jgi:hypothetical protein
MFRTGLISPTELLVLLLPLFGGLGAGARGFGFGFPLGGVALSVGLILLSLALAYEVITAGHGARDLLSLSLDALDSTLDGFFWSAVVPHRVLLLFRDQ